MWRTSLATETDYVRGRLAEYTNDLLSLGVDGLRVDAAKREQDLPPSLGVLRSHNDALVDMDPDDIADILSRLTTQPYVTQEVSTGLLS